jgi:hypothetical protein
MRCPPCPETSAGIAEIRIHGTIDGDPDPPRADDRSRVDALETYLADCAEVPMLIDTGGWDPVSVAQACRAALTDHNAVRWEAQHGGLRMSSDAEQILDMYRNAVATSEVASEFAADDETLREALRAAWTLERANDALAYGASPAECQTAIVCSDGDGIQYYDRTDHTWKGYVFKSKMARCKYKFRCLRGAAVIHEQWVDVNQDPTIETIPVPKSN